MVWRYMKIKHSVVYVYEIHLTLTFDPRSNNGRKLVNDARAISTLLFKIGQWFLVFGFMTTTRCAIHTILTPWPLTPLSNNWRNCPGDIIFSFQDRSIIFGMWVHNHYIIVALIWPLTPRSDNWQNMSRSNFICLLR